MNEFFNDLMGMLWVQPDGPATISYPLFCHDVDGVDVPLGDVTTSPPNYLYGDCWPTHVGGGGRGQ